MVQKNIELLAKGRAMQLSTIDTSSGRVIIIETDEDLDLSSYEVFVHACRLAEYPDMSTIEVNLANTKNIRGSGVDMLLMLHARANGLSNRIRLVNCSAKIRRQLTTSRVGKQFQVL
jgi:anti-anti-sigma regulatory factor